LVIYGANTGTRGVKSTNCVKIARCPRLVSYNNEANVRIIKIAKPRRYLCQNSKFLYDVWNRDKGSGAWLPGAGGLSTCPNVKQKWVVLAVPSARE
jgi:hypothetical protein